MAREQRYQLATEEAWLRRAEAGPQRDFLTFLVGSEEYGVDIQHIREIIKVRPVTEVPHAPEFIIGVIAVRGVVLPVLDLHRRLRLPSGGMARSARFLVVENNDEPFGLLVDEVMQVVRFSEAEIEPPPPIPGTVESGFLDGIGRARGRMVILLDLAEVLSFEIRRARTSEHAAMQQSRTRRGVDAPRGDRR